MLDVPKVNNVEVEVLLLDTNIPYLGILTYDDELWIVDRRVINADTKLISRGQMAIMYKVEELETILAQLSDEQTEKKKRLKKRSLSVKIRDCLISKGRVIRLK